MGVLNWKAYEKPLEARIDTLEELMRMREKWDAERSRTTVVYAIKGWLDETAGNIMDDLDSQHKLEQPLVHL